jgi:glycosyltransferase involved in cell wall biosynthesis
VSPEKPEAFAQTVLDVLEDPQRAAKLSSQARVYAQSWASASMAGRLAELYREIIARRAVPESSAASRTSAAA